jgi:hypothetical protein
VKIPISRRCIDVTPFLAMEIMEQAKALEAAGQEIIYLCLGEHIDGNSKGLALDILKTTGVALTRHRFRRGGRGLPALHLR